MLKHRLISVFLTGLNRFFLAVVSSSVLKLCYLLFKGEEVSASVGDSKSTLPTPQAKFLKKQFYQL